MERVKKIANKFNLDLINDNCHALRAKYFEDPYYAIKYADVVIQSFHPVKIITTGEGGAIVTNNEKIYQKVKLLRTHGISKPDLNDIGPWFYEMKDLGYNYRITDIQSALGSNQLKSEKVSIEKKKIARYYDSVFKSDPIIKTPINSINVTHAYHLYPIQINFEICKVKKERAIQNNVQLRL